MKAIQIKGYIGFYAQKSGCIYNINGIKLSLRLKTQYRYAMYVINNKNSCVYF